MFTCCLKPFNTKVISVLFAFNAMSLMNVIHLFAPSFPQAPWSLRETQQIQLQQVSLLGYQECEIWFSAVYLLSKTYVFFLFSMQSSTPQCSGTVHLETMCGWTKPCWISSRGKAETWTHSDLRLRTHYVTFCLSLIWIFYWNISSQIKYAYGRVSASSARRLATKSSNKMI